MTGNSRKRNLAARREKARTLFKTVRLADDLELAGQLEDLEDEVRSARLRAEAFKGDERAQAQYAEAQEGLANWLKANEDNYTEFKFKRIGYKAYDDLVKQHPPTDEQYEQAKKAGLDPLTAVPWNPETFMPALLWASLDKEDGITEEQFLRDIEELMTLGELQILFGAALEINTMGVNLNRRAMGKDLRSTTGSRK